MTSAFEFVAAGFLLAAMATLATADETKDAAIKKDRKQTTRKLCFVSLGTERPTEFASTPGSQRLLVTFEREPKGNQ